MTLWTLPPGRSTGVHSHGFDYAVLPLAGGELTATSPDGARTVLTLVTKVPYFRTAGTIHDIACSGPETVEFVEIELLERR